MTTNTAPEAIADYEEIARAMESRAATYGLLARLYRREVDAPLLDELKTVHFPLNTGNSQVDSGYRLMVGYLSKTWENTLTELAADYLRTFLGHGIDGHSAAYPYESVYTSERRLLMQDARTEILALFRANGLEKDPSFKDAEDHIALELEFMAAAGAPVRRGAAGRQRRRRPGAGAQPGHFPRRAPNGLGAAVHHRNAEVRENRFLPGPQPHHRRLPGRRPGDAGRDGRKRRGIAALLRQFLAPAEPLLPAGAP